MYAELFKINQLEKGWFIISKISVASTKSKCLSLQRLKHLLKKLFWQINKITIKSCQLSSHYVCRKMMYKICKLCWYFFWWTTIPRFNQTWKTIDSDTWSSSTFWVNLWQNNILNILLPTQTRIQLAMHKNQRKHNYKSIETKTLKMKWRTWQSWTQKNL